MNTSTQTEIVVQETQKFRTQMGEISRQSGIFFAGTVFTAAAGYVFKVYLARALGAEALGIYALGMTVAGFFGVFGGVGLTWAAARFPAIYKSTGRLQQLRAFLFWGIAALVLVNGVFAACIVAARHWVANSLYHTPTLERYFYLFALIMFLGALTTFFGQLLTGYKDVVRRTVITNFFGSPLMMLFTVMFVAMGTGLWGYLFAQVASAVAVLLLLVGAAHRLTPREARFSLQPIRGLEPEIFSFCFTAFTMDVMSFASNQTDKIVLGLYLDAKSVGVYAVATAIVTFVPIILQSVNQIFSPTIADLHARGEKELLGRLFTTLTKWIFSLTMPLATVVIVFAHPLMRIFGRDFESGWVVLVIGTIGQLVNCGVGSVGYLLLMSGNQKRLLKIQGAMAVMMILLTVFLVPGLGVTGAAMAAAATNAGTNVWSLWEVRRALGLLPYNRSYVRFVPSAVLLILVSLVLKIKLKALSADWVELAVGLVVSYAVFFGAVLAFGLDPDDRLIGRAIWSRLRSALPRVEENAA